MPVGLSPADKDPEPVAAETGGASPRALTEGDMDEWVHRNRIVLFALMVVLVLAGVLLIQSGRREPVPILLATATNLPTPEFTAVPPPLRVYVSGAVQHPDVYTLPPGSIAKDAVMAAGGPSHDADLDRINLATALVDGQHIYVPHQQEEELPVELPSDQRSVGLRININTADASTLETLPGIGPTLAQRIIDYRKANGPFAQPEDVMNVSGVGPAIFAKIEESISTK